jgi:hypothetical protein
MAGMPGAMGRRMNIVQLGAMRARVGSDRTSDSAQQRADDDPDIVENALPVRAGLP